MSRRILIVGAGRSGLQLAHGLRSEGYEVTVMTAQRPEEIRTAAPSITQFSAGATRVAEQLLNLDFYTRLAPPITGLHLELYPPGAPAPLTLAGAFGAPALAVDSRHLQADWVEALEDRGGRIVYHGCTVSDLAYFTSMYDLVVVATGAAMLGGLFPDTTAPDQVRAHQRVVTQVLCEGVAPSPSGPDHLEVVSSPQGRIIIAPILSPYGPATSVCVMDSPGGSLDGSHLRPQRGRPDPQTVLDWTSESLRNHFGEIALRVEDAEPIDAYAALVTTVRPHVREPVAVAGAGHVLGLGDTVVHTDPLAGQGWGVSSLSASVYLHRILDHGDVPFTPVWMAETFAAAWRTGVAAAHRLSSTLHSMWEPGAPPHLGEVLTAAARSPAVADRFAAGLIDPGDYEKWLYAPDAARAFIAQATRT